MVADLLQSPGLVGSKVRISTSTPPTVSRSVVPTAKRRSATVLTTDSNRLETCKAWARASSATCRAAWSRIIPDATTQAPIPVHTTKNSASAEVAAATRVESR